MEIIVYAQKLMDLEDSISILIYEIYCILQKKLKTVEITKYFLFRFRLPSSNPLSVFSALEFFWVRWWWWVFSTGLYPLSTRIGAVSCPSMKASSSPLCSVFRSWQLCRAMANPRWIALGYSLLVCGTRIGDCCILCGWRKCLVPGFVSRCCTPCLWSEAVSLWGIVKSVGW